MIGYTPNPTLLPTGIGVGFSADFGAPAPRDATYFREMSELSNFFYVRIDTYSILWYKNSR